MIVEEGDPCVDGKCKGKFIFPPAENCSCHINPPCQSCVSVKLECSVCGMDEDDAYEQEKGGTAYSGSGIRAMFRRVRGKAGLNDVTFHDLRRKAGSDVDLIDAQTLLQHSDGKVTARHYRAKMDRVRPVK